MKYDWLCRTSDFTLTESARGSDSEDEVLRMKRKNAIASDSEADSDTEVPKGTSITFFNMLISIPLFVFNYSTPWAFTPDCKTHRKNVDTLSVHRGIVQIWEPVYAVSLEEPISSFLIRVNLLLGAEALVQVEAAVFILQFEWQFQDSFFLSS